MLLHDDIGVRAVSLRVITARAGTSIDGTRHASRASPQRIATVLTHDEEIVGECELFARVAEGIISRKLAPRTLRRLQV
jgi:hypothetical protein